MAELIGRYPKHDCRRDELPDFWDYGQFCDGDVVRCSCGQYWLTIYGDRGRYEKLKGRRLAKILAEIGTVE